MGINEILHLTLGIIFFVVFIYAAIISIYEKESRAALLFLASAMLFSIPNFILWIEIDNFGLTISTIIILVQLIPIVLLLLPIRVKNDKNHNTPLSRIDERDIMFSRSNLEPGSQNFLDYYKLRPEHKKPDDQFRLKPGLLSPESSKYHLATFSAADANFNVVGTLKQLITGPIADKQQKTDRYKTTEFIKRWGKEIGASDIGITALKDYHKYTVIGRGKDYGKEVDLDHKYAIAIIIEKDEDHVSSSPQGPVIMESSDKYLRTGTVAVQIAEFIRNLGYDARAHIDGSYQVVCPLVARDAGLGEIGRMGLLMTKKYGPRVRISTVTTNMPLHTNTAKPDNSIINFCEHCKKCATNCPASAVPNGAMEDHNRTTRWKINSDACFYFWNISGTDCGICMKVCPYSHPNNALHTAIKWGISNNKLFSKIALHLDDLFYGKKPKTKKIPEWMDII